MVGGRAARPAQRGATARARGAGRRLLRRRPHLLAPRDRGRRRRPRHRAGQPAGRASSPLVAWLVLGERPAARVLATLPLVLSRRRAHLGRARGRRLRRRPDPGRGLRRRHRARLHGLHPRAARGQRRAAARRRPAVRRHARRRGRVRGGRGGSSATRTSSRRGPPTRGWSMLALTSQVLGWLLISASLPRLPAALDVAAADDPAGGLGRPRRDAVRRGAVGAAARRRRCDPGTGLVMVARVRPPPTEGISGSPPCACGDARRLLHHRGEADPGRRDRRRSSSAG